MIRDKIGKQYNKKILQNKQKMRIKRMTKFDSKIIWYKMLRGEIENKIQLEKW
jgi:hypothetical protein